MKLVDWRHSIRAVIALLLVACSNAEESVIDSRFEAIPEWQVAAAGTVIANDETAATQFNRPIPARVSDGRLMVADVGSAELRLFENGSLSKRLSRSGNGPGELTGTFTIAMAADTIFTIGGTGTLGEINRFTLDGGFQKRFRLKHPDGVTRLSPIDRLVGGEYLARVGSGVRILREAPPAGRLAADSVSLLIYRPDQTDSSGVVVPIGRYLTGWLVPHRWPSGPMPIAQSTYPLRAGTYWAVAGDRIWIVDAGSGEMKALDGSGAVIVSTVLPLPPLQFDLQSIDRARQQALKEASSDFQREAALAVYNPAFLPATMPLFDKLLGNRDGSILLRRYALERGAMADWLAVDSIGKTTGRIRLPSSFAPFQFGDDYILGVATDSSGVETVTEFRVVKSRSSH